MRLFSLLFLFILLFSQSIILVSCSSSEFDRVAIVDNVVDGDTFDILEGDRIRLADIDTPEQIINYVGFWQAFSYLRSLILDKTVYLDIDDKYTFDTTGNRIVCVVYIEYNQTHYLNVNKDLLDRNLAVIWEHDNEFNPNSWILYVKKNDIPEFSSLNLLLLILLCHFIFLLRHIRKPRNLENK